MSDSEKHDSVDRLVAAYERMLERVNGALKHAEKTAVPTLRHALEQAREKAVELDEITREEADRVADYLERDMQDAASYLVETGQQLRDWWRFDLQLVENRLWEMFSNVADQTSVQLREMAERARQAAVYRTGEITGPGTLICAGCGKELHFTQAGHIPPCPKCKGTKYRRRSA